MTLEGTNTYVVGSDPAYVIDPGPATSLTSTRSAPPARSAAGSPGVLLTHSHADHSAGVEMLGAPLLHGKISEGDETSRRRRPKRPPRKLSWLAGTVAQ